MNINFYSDNESLVGRDVLACALYAKLVNAGYKVVRHYFPPRPFGCNCEEPVYDYHAWLASGMEIMEVNQIRIITQPIEWVGNRKDLSELKEIIANEPEINYLVVSELSTEKYKNCEQSTQEVRKIMNIKKVNVVFAKEGFIEQSVHTMYDIFLKEVLELEKKGLKGDMVVRKQVIEMEAIDNAGH